MQHKTGLGDVYGSEFATSEQVEATNTWKHEQRIAKERARVYARWAKYAIHYAERSFEDPEPWAVVRVKTGRVVRRFETEVFAIEWIGELPEED